MSFQIHEQYLDLESGHHVVKLRDGKKEHIVQWPVGIDSCPTCGHVHPKTNLDEIDPKAMVAEVIESINQSHTNMHEYAKKHGIPIK